MTSDSRRLTDANRAAAEHSKHGIHLPRIPLRPRKINPDEITLSSSSASSEDSDIEIAEASQRVKKRTSEMSKPVLFYGKPNQLPQVLTYCKVKFLADGSDDSEDTSQQAAQLASLFRGPALTWLTEQLQSDKHLLDDYDAFAGKVHDTFALDRHAEEAQAASALANCRQTSSVQEYALRFQTLAKKAAIPDPTAVAFFQKGLKQHIRQSLIVTNQNGKLEHVIAEAARIDAQTYYSKSGNSRSGGHSTNRGRRRGRGRGQH